MTQITIIYEKHGERKERKHGSVVKLRWEKRSGDREMQKKKDETVMGGKE